MDSEKVNTKTKNLQKNFYKKFKNRKFLYINSKKEYNAVLEVFEDSIEKAKEIDEKIKNGFSGKLAGVPVIIKDNILYDGKICSCSSKFLKDYVAQYNATVVQKMLEHGHNQLDYE